MNKFYPLLDYLTHQKPLKPITWHTWLINPIMGGANNLVYRVSNNTVDLAVKFTIKDSRNRASREYHALLALQQANLAIAPAPGQTHKLCKVRENIKQKARLQSRFETLRANATSPIMTAKQIESQMT